MINCNEHNKLKIISLFIWLKILANVCKGIKQGGTNDEKRTTYSETTHPFSWNT